MVCSPRPDGEDVLAAASSLGPWLGEQRVTRNRWAIRTGEYPPQPGGVSVYTRQAARGLAEAGDEVHVWAPASAGEAATDAGVQVHRLPDRFGSRGLRRLAAELNALPGDARILVQYVPQAFGWKAM